MKNNESQINIFEAKEHQLLNESDYNCGFALHYDDNFDMQLMEEERAIRIIQQRYLKTMRMIENSENSLNSSEYDIDFFVKDKNDGYKKVKPTLLHQITKDILIILNACDSEEHNLFKDCFKISNNSDKQIGNILDVLKDYEDHLLKIKDDPLAKHFLYYPVYGNKFELIELTVNEYETKKDFTIKGLVHNSYNALEERMKGKEKKAL